MNRQSEVGIFIARIILGIIFVMHGYDKFSGGISNIGAWFDSIGIPSFAAYIVATIELVGGIFLILGLGTRVVAALISIIMIVATLKVKLAVGFLGNGEMAGYELDLALLGISLMLVLVGSRFLSVDSWVKKALFQK